MNNESETQFNDYLDLLKNQKQNWQPIKTGQKYDNSIVGLNIENKKYCIVKLSSKEGTVNSFYGIKEDCISYENDSVCFHPTKWIKITNLFKFNNQNINLCPKNPNPTSPNQPKLNPPK
jgi:hypothetical protein